MKRSKTGIAALCLALSSPLPTGASETDMANPSAVLSEAVRKLRYPTAIYVLRDDGDSVAAAGMADANVGRPLGVDTPLRIASNTKTFTAATVLRLWEQGRIDLDAPIVELIAPEFDRVLRRDGYDPGRITVRQLLSHSAGLFDHGSDPRFAKSFLADPARVWKPIELVTLMTEYADPQSAPGTEFRYSDDGYILLGHIVERITGQTLAAAVREQLGFNRLGLNDSWWEIMEEPPAGAGPRARQWLGNQDVTDVNASIDLYGGGGLLMSARDMARFFKALFEGRVFARGETMQEMLRPGPHKGSDHYRLGIFVDHIGGRDVYWHSGFWGTYALYDPETRTAAAGVTTNQEGYRDLVSIVRAKVPRR